MLVSSFIKVMILVVSFFLITENGLSQDKKMVHLQQLLSGIGDEVDEEMSADELFEYVENPLNINSYSIEKYILLGLINEFQVKSLQNYMRKFGLLISYNELYNVYGFDSLTIANLKDYVIIAPSDNMYSYSLKDASLFGKSQLLLRIQQGIQKPDGYQFVTDSLKSISKKYLGNRSKLYARYKFSFKKYIRLGFTLEKDAGEEFFKGTQKYGFDFVSSNLYVKQNRKLKSFVIGDYRLSVGQGLTLSNMFSLSKSSVGMQIRKCESGFKPYSSVDENNFLRGAAASFLLWSNVDMIVFSSWKKRDGSLSGYHNTASRMIKRKQDREVVCGSHISHLGDNYKLGLSGYFASFNTNKPKSTSLQDYFGFHGNELFCVGADYQYDFRKSNVFGEASVDKYGNVSVLNGLELSLHRYFFLSLLFRNTEKAYINLYNNVFGGSGNKPGHGFFCTMKTFPLRNCEMTAYLEYYKYSWLRYGCYRPMPFLENYLQFLMRFSEKNEFYLRIRQKDDYKNSEIGNNIRLVSLESKKSCRFNFRYFLFSEIIFQSRLEIVDFRNETEGSKTGVLILQDVNFRPKKKPWALSLRYAIFDTDGYDTRIYAYENDLLYLFTVLPYYNKGSRFYALLKYDFGENINAYIRFSATSYQGVTSLREGLDKINGNLLSEIKIQLRIKL